MLQLDGIGKKFGNKIFEGASLEIASGTGAQVLGQNGSGKSTLLKMIAGVLSPDTGRILLDGNPVQRQKKRLTYCPSGAAGFYRRLSVRQNLRYFGSLYGLTRNQVDSRIASLGIFEIDYWDMTVEKLSDGMLQKVKITRAFLHNPVLALLDEPLNTLDQASRKGFLSWLERWVTSGPNHFVIAQHSDQIQGKAWRIRNFRIEETAP